MPASVSSPADIVNLALVRIGHPLRIGSLFEGSPAAKKALDIYAQTRDEMLREQNPGFASRDLSMILLKSAPYPIYPAGQWNNTFPPLPWLFEYQLPGDFIKVRAVKPSPLTLPVLLPAPKVWRLANDNALVPPQQVLLCNVPSAILVYTAQITDPAAMEPLFIESLAAALARRLTVALADARLIEAEAKDESAETASAEMKQG